MRKRSPKPRRGKKPAKFVQIAATATIRDDHSRIYALDANGAVWYAWRNRNHDGTITGWNRIPMKRHGDDFPGQLLDDGDDLPF
jgi:hypothetical protein